MASAAAATFRRRTVLATILGTCLATAVTAIGLSDATSAFADPVDLQVIDRATHQPLRVWRHDGRLFVAGRPGARYSLRVTNNTDGRVLVVMSVDGVNILTGETAGYDQRGYIFDAHDSYEVTGWRKSTTEVAAFAFAPLPQSYAARTGRPADVGVIGMAVFDEKVEPPPEADTAPQAEPDLSGGQPAPDRAWRNRQSLAAPMMAPPPPPAAALAAPPPTSTVTAERRDDRLGTAHGPRERSVITEEPFERATTYPQIVRQIEYDTYDHLVASGIIPAEDDHRPRPFPAYPDGERFVPDPPGGP
jgi:hypothetical protein